MDVGQICIKIKGREAGRKAVVLSEVTDGKVLIDGVQLRRKKCNVLHLFPTNDKIKISKDASHEEVVKLLKA
jgi:large subunit ribosomal protein L14e